MVLCFITHIYIFQCQTSPLGLKVDFEIFMKTRVLNKIADKNPARPFLVYIYTLDFLSQFGQMDELACGRVVVW